MHMHAPATRPRRLSIAVYECGVCVLQRPGLPQRVPSPQELVAHTQAIMQSALIKKQLEDQKERFLKRQQETSVVYVLYSTYSTYSCVLDFNIFITKNISIYIIYGHVLNSKQSHLIFDPP